jgi:IclR family acetate operon transcriptional repressor
MASVKSLNVVSNALVLLEALARHQPAGVSELARITGIDKSAAQRILVTLHEGGWIRRPDSAATNWELSDLPIQIFTHPSRSRLIGRAEPVLRRLRDQTGETTMLAVFEHGELLIIAAAESPHAVRVAPPQLPYQVPLAHSSAGRAVAASLPTADIPRLLGEAATDAELRVLDRVRERGWSEIDEALFPQTHSMAAALRRRDGTPIGAVMVAAPAFRLEGADHERVGQLVMAAADDVMRDGA